MDYMIEKNIKFYQSFKDFQIEKSKNCIDDPKASYLIQFDKNDTILFSESLAFQTIFIKLSKID